MGNADRQAKLQLIDTQLQEFADDIQREYSYAVDVVSLTDQIRSLQIYLTQRDCNQRAPFVIISVITNSVDSTPLHVSLRGGAIWLDDWLDNKQLQLMSAINELNQKVQAIWSTSSSSSTSK